MDNRVRLSAIGDILLSGIVEELIESKGLKEPFTFVSDTFEKSDMVFGNLECPLSNRGVPLKGKCCLYSPSKTFQSLKLAGFNVLSLANNHIFDYGYEGFVDTISIFKKSNVYWFGAGRNLYEAVKPAILNINGISIAFLGYAWDFIGALNAGKDSFGTAPLNEKLIIKNVRNVAEKVDFVIVSLHWGYDGEIYPLPSHRKIAHKMIDEGADLILGHHPHVIQGIEKYYEGIILYSLGNFIFPDIQYKDYSIIQKPENRESIMFQCEISKKGINYFDIIPIKCNEFFQPIVLKNKEKTKKLKKIRELSKPLESDDYHHFWKNNRVRSGLPDMGEHKFFNTIVYKLLRLKSIIETVFVKIKKVINQILKRRKWQICPEP